VVPFLDTLEGLATKVGIKAETASVDIAPDSLSLLVKINTSGSFEAIYKFLTLLENSPYELEFTGFDMQKEDSILATPDLVLNKDIKKQNSKWRATFNIKLLSFTQ
jgi:translation initiation factor IF-2